MPAINPLPQRIASNNAPAFGPTGQDYVQADISPQDLADGVCVIVDNHQGGTQTVRAVIDRHYHNHDEQFFAISEIEGYEQIEFDAHGNNIGRRPVYTIRHNDVIDDVAAQILAEAFANRLINIEYPIARKIQATYAAEIRRLCDAIITSGADNFTIAIDNADSAAKRKRHGYDSEMIRAMTDLIARQNPVSGFIYSSTGPGNVIIEALRRCDVPVGKRIKAAEAVRGFAAMTTSDVLTYWDRAYSHRTVANEHAWKYDRNRPGAPALLNLPTTSAILMGNTPAASQNATVLNLRRQIAAQQAQAAAAATASAQKPKTNRITSKSSKAALAVHKVEAHPAQRRERMKFEGGSLIDYLRNDGIRSADIVVSAVTALMTYEVAFEGKPRSRDLESAAAFAKTDAVINLALRASATCERAGINSRGAFACAHALCEEADPVAADVFFKGMKRGATDNSPAATLVRRLSGLTRAERTPHRVLDYTMQAWQAHVEGRAVTQFFDHAEIGLSANDNDKAALKAA